MRYAKTLVLYAILCRGMLSIDDPNELIYELVTSEILKNVDFYLTSLPKAIIHSFNVSFLFPRMEWNEAFAIPGSDEFSCFTEKIRRRLKNVYYADQREFVGSQPFSMRDYNNNTYVIADFTLSFVKNISWPAWNITRVVQLFPSKFKGLIEIYKYPAINESYNPTVEYETYETQWFAVLKDVHDLIGEKDTVSYFSYYDIPPPPETYFGADSLSVANLFFYGLLGFNIFAIVLVFFFWCVNGTRDSLLLSYWLKGSDDLKRKGVSTTPGDI